MINTYRMASEDVIELGSSDEEARPPSPKKMKPKENAMVHIPGKSFKGLTIKPVKIPKTMKQLTQKPLVTKPVIINKNVTCTKIMNGAKTVSPNLHVQIAPTTPNRPPSKKYKPLTTVINPFGLPVNTISVVKPNKPTMVKPRPSAAPVKLPPSITITRTVPKGKPNSSGKPNLLAKPNPLKLVSATSLQKVQPKPTPKEVLTIDSDDDEGPKTPKVSSAAAPWYLPPETQSKEKEIEKQNNREPETRKFIEITIDDSPIKPPLNKRTCEVGSELAITIDDSPVKVTQEGGEASDGEPVTKKSKTPNSKKRLKYPKETTRIEIEIEPMQIDDPLDTNSEQTRSYTIPIEIQDSPAKKVTSSPKKGESIEKGVQSSEFHPVYQSFIDLCLKLEDSEDMRKIVDKKIKGYYKQVPKEYTESEEFIDMVSSKILSMKAGPEKMYLYIKDIVDELNLQRKVSKNQVAQKEVDAEPEPFIYGENSEFDTKRQRQIRKLEKTLKKLHRAIQKLEEQEVDFDDEEDSVYLLTERYKERMVRVHAKLCQLTNTKMPSEPRVHIDARPGKPSGPAKRLEKWINKKVPIGTPLPFPDFHDVLRCVKEANEQDKLGWNEVDVMEEARDLFVRCGKKLQRRRQENEWRLAASRIPVDIDPAADSELLRKKLDENRLVASKKETDVFNKYADRQSQLKLEAVEIGDKEAEESPVESDDDEPQEEESTLENKEKRKERLKRLIQEKTKKADEKTEPKENNESPSTETVLEEKQQEDTAKPTDSIKTKENDTEKELKPDNDEKVDNGSNGSPDEVHSINSDDENKVDSDVDELHLLQKLHSGNDANSSTIESSDSDTPIDISDTLQSSSDNKGKPSSGVISIENSSYSESEANDANGSKESVKTADKMVDATEEIELSCIPPDKKTQQDNNDEYGESVEGILLASSDDEKQNSDDENTVNNDECVNLKDDAISIGDAEMGESNGDEKQNSSDENTANNDECINLKDDAISIGDTEVSPNKNSVSAAENINKDVVSPNTESITIEDSQPIESMDVDNAEDTTNSSDIKSKNGDVLQTESSHKITNGVVAKESTEQIEKNDNVPNIEGKEDTVEIDDSSNKSNESEIASDGMNQIDKAKPQDMLLDNVIVTPNEKTPTAVDSAA